MNTAVKPQALIPKETLRQLGKRSDERGLRQLGFHVGLILLLGLLASHMADSTWHLLFVFVYGVPLIFLFAPLHEAIHNTAFKSRWLNEWVAAICGFILLIPARYFRLFHFDHHRFTQSPGDDPELQVDKPASRPEFFWQMSGLPLWWALLRMLANYARGRITARFIRDEDRPTVILEARVHLALYVILFVGSLLTGNAFLWWYWVLPLLLCQPLLRLYLLAEHHGCDLGDDMLSNTRTIHTNAVVRFLAWNMPYHAEHHCLPSIPFHQLPRLHGYLKNHVKHQQPGYLALTRDIYQQLA